MATWHYVQGGEQRGPVGEAELVALARSGALPLDVLVWTEGMADWEPLRSTRLAAAIGSTPSSATPPPLAPQPVSVAFPPVHGAPLVERKSRVAYILFAVLLGFGVHNFYAGYTSRAVLQLVLWCTGLIGSVVCCGVGAPLLLFVWIWGIAEACTTTVDADGRPFQG